MALKKQLNRQFFNDFKNDPEAAFKRFGINDFNEEDRRFFKQAESFDDFEKLLKKSRFAAFFDFSA